MTPTPGHISRRYQRDQILGAMLTLDTLIEECILLHARPTLACSYCESLNTILEALDKLRDTASSHQRAFLVETMGRRSGYLALMAGIIGGAEVVMIPEIETSLEEVAAALNDAYVRGKTHAIVVIAEGASHRTTDVARFLEQHADGFQVRVTILGHLQRGGRPSAFDRLLSARLGVAAVELIVGGGSGVMVGLDGREVTSLPLEEVTLHPRQANLDYLRMMRILAR